MVHYAVLDFQAVIDKDLSSQSRIDCFSGLLCIESLILCLFGPYIVNLRHHELTDFQTFDHFHIIAIIIHLLTSLASGLASLTSLGLQTLMPLAR